jgi:isohexenylglutaconyl-CoA hydratase
VDALADNSAALDTLLAQWLTHIGRCGPQANAEFKTLVARCGTEPLPDTLDHAALRFSACLRGEGAEGIAAFKEKREPTWVVRFEAGEVSG